jgi:hypothetical protein
MPRVGFEPTIPVFERAKTVHASDRVATVIGHGRSTEVYFPSNFQILPNLILSCYVSFLGSILCISG